SDNSSFFEKDVPVLFFFSGVHEDYHRPGDDAHKIHAEPATRVVHLVHDVLRAVDARDERPTFVKALGAANYFIPDVRYGIELDPPWPAGRAGLREGDVIFRVDNREPDGFEELRAMLETTDDKRTARRFVVWRARDGAAVPGAERPFAGTWSEWNEGYRWIEVG